MDSQYKGKVSRETLKQKVEKLFPDENFYFFQLRQNEIEMKEEWEQMKKFINDNIKCKRYFIEEGLLEPVHLNPSECNILVEGMSQMMKNCQQEIEI